MNPITDLFRGIKQNDEKFAKGTYFQKPESTEIFLQVVNIAWMIFDPRRALFSRLSMMIN